MKKSYLFLLSGFVFLGGAIFWGGRLIKNLPQNPPIAVLEVDSLPQTRVFLDGKELGQTPFENSELSPGEYTLRLQMETNASFSFWERRIKLNPRLSTYVNYLFGPTERESAGEVLTLEKVAGEKGEMVVLSDPDGAKFSLDGEEKGVTPQALSGFASGDHQISLSFLGYRERSLQVKTWAGQKLSAYVKLAGIPEPPPEIVASESAVLKVKILQTPTGWLRVRGEPSLSATESARVDPGGEYPLLEEDGDWFKIQYEDGKEGWISSRYAQKIDLQLKP
ncbi:MAG: PEGA domain-containing protein [bacterium]|nr:PEGA domain-containing protein [bacterium]